LEAIRITRVLYFNNFAVVPFQDTVKEIIIKGLKPLTNPDSGSPVLELDFAGKKKSDYSIFFDNTSNKGPDNSIGNWRAVGGEGLTGGVSLKTIEELNFCDDVDDPKTCEPIFRRSPDELGKQIAYVTLHELGHQFGLMEKASFAGADSEGHTGDPTNFMFVTGLHKDFKTIAKDYGRTRKYAVQQGETIPSIAKRIGFRSPSSMSWIDLYELKGTDNRSNKDTIKSKNPKILQPGEEIWVPDIKARRDFIREINVKVEKSFTKPQIDLIKNWIMQGKNYFSGGNP
jgi:hypothetical protein